MAFPIVRIFMMSLKYASEPLAMGFKWLLLHGHLTYFNGFFIKIGQRSNQLE